MQNGQPAWWDTDLGKQIQAIAAQLDAVNAQYSVPGDDASEDDLRGWIKAKESWLKQRATAGARR